MFYEKEISFDVNQKKHICYKRNTTNRYFLIPLQEKKLATAKMLS